MNWELKYDQVFVSDIKKLDKPIQVRVMRSIQNKLQTNPLVFAKPLTQNLNGIWQYREGAYRIFFEVGENQLYFLGVLHRSVAHKTLVKRIR